MAERLNFVGGVARNKGRIWGERILCTLAAVGFGFWIETWFSLIGSTVGCFSFGCMQRLIRSDYSQVSGRLDGWDEFLPRLFAAAASCRWGLHLDEIVFLKHSLCFSNI